MPGARKRSASVLNAKFGLIGNLLVVGGAVQQRGLTPNAHGQPVVRRQDDRAVEAALAAAVALVGEDEEAKDNMSMMIDMLLIGYDRVSVL